MYGRRLPDEENEAGCDAEDDEGRSTRPEADSGEPALGVAQTEAAEVHEARLRIIAELTFHKAVGQEPDYVS